MSIAQGGVARWLLRCQRSTDARLGLSDRGLDPLGTRDGRVGTVQLAGETVGDDPFPGDDRRQ